MKVTDTGSNSLPFNLNLLGLVDGWVTSTRANKLTDANSKVIISLTGK